MSDQVISLTSSDEEDNAEPPPKKFRSSPNLPECTLTLVSSPKTSDTCSNTIETVTLDSDDEVIDGKNDCTKEKPINSLGTVKEIVTSTDNKVDLISLTDDEDDIQPKVDEINGIINSIFNPKADKSFTKINDSFVQTNNETVSIDDSDTETETTSKDMESSTDKSEADIVRKGSRREKSKDSIIIDDSDDEREKENHCEDGLIDPFPVQVEKTCASEVSSACTSKDETTEAKLLFKKFVKMVEEKIVDSKFEEILPKKVPIINKYFNRSGLYVNDKTFKTLLIDSIADVKNALTANGANTAVLAFHKVFEHLKLHMAETTIVVELDNLPKIKKLEQTIKLLRKRIQQLEVAEVNFDDDEDSAYIMLDRYQSRLNKVYAKYCQYIKRNQYSGRATYDRITFVNSSYNEINRALTKKYKNSLVFPSYFELKDYITKISKREELKLSEGEIEIESKKCFQLLGNILQKKRRQELYDSHLDFGCSEDPATKDISLENALKKSSVEMKEKMDKVCQKYVNKQERGEDKVSTEEEQSSEESNDGSNKIQKAKVKKNGMVNIKKKGGDSKDKKYHHNNKVENGKEEVENRNGKKDIQEDIEDLDGKKSCEDEEPKSQEDKKDTQEKSIKIQEDRKNIQKDKIENQIDFLSVLNIKKQTVDNLGNKEDLQLNKEENPT